MAPANDDDRRRWSNDTDTYLHYNATLLYREYSSEYMVDSLNSLRDQCVHCWIMQSRCAPSGEVSDHICPDDVGPVRWNNMEDKFASEIQRDGRRCIECLSPVSRKYCHSGYHCETGDDWRAAWLTVTYASYLVVQIRRNVFTQLGLPLIKFESLVHYAHWCSLVVQGQSDAHLTNGVMVVFAFFMLEDKEVSFGTRYSLPGETPHAQYRRHHI